MVISEDTKSEQNELSDATRGHLRELIAELRAEKSKLEIKYQDELEKINHNLQAVQRTLGLLSGETFEQNRTSTQAEFDLVSIAKAKSHREAIKLMAEQNNGIINVTKAGETLIRAGRANSKRRNLISGIHHILTHSEEWEKVSPGNFKLKTVSDQSSEV
jgi:hypothetical protein